MAPATQSTILGNQVADLLLRNARGVLKSILDYLHDLVAFGDNQGAKVGRNSPSLAKMDHHFLNELLRHRRCHILLTFVVSPSLADEDKDLWVVIEGLIQSILFVRRASKHGDTHFFFRHPEGLCDPRNHFSPLAGRSR